MSQTTHTQTLPPSSSPNTTTTTTTNANNNGTTTKPSTTDQADDSIISDRLARKRARDRKSQRAMRDRVRWVIEELEQRVKFLSEALANESAAHHSFRQFSVQETERLRAENRVLRMRVEGSGFVESAVRLDDDGDHDEQTRVFTGQQQGFGGGAGSGGGGIHAAGLSDGGDSSGLHWRNPPPPRQPHEVVPWTTEPTCLSDQIVQGYIEARRAMLRDGGPFQHDIVQPAQPNINAILNPNKNAETRSVQEVSTVVSDILLSYHEIDTLPKKVSCLYNIYKLLNWFIYRTPETYAQLPVWLRPEPIQIKVQHPAWIDRIPWPGVRVYLIEHPEVTFDDFAAAYSSSFEISWPYSPSHVVITSPSTPSAFQRSSTPRNPHLPEGATPTLSTSVQAGQQASSLLTLPPTSSQEPPPVEQNVGMSLNPVYEQHIRQLKNWTVGEKFRRKFPEIGKIVDSDCLRVYGS